MRLLLISLLAVVLLAAAYVVGRFQATTVVEPPDADWVQDRPAALAWQKFLTSAEHAASTVAEDEEALAYLADLASASFEMKVSNGDPADPRFTDWMASGRKFLGDSPDATYHSAQVSSRYSYRIVGYQGDADYTGLMAYGRAVNGWNRTAGNLAYDEITFDADGRFEVIASATQPEGDVAWLPLTDDAHMIMVRRYYFDPVNSQRGRVRIERIDAEPSELLPTAQRIDNATQFFNETYRGTRALIEMLSSAPNDPEPPPSYNQDFVGVFYPTDDNTYYGTWYSIEEGEALVIEGEAPQALYWSVSLQTRWLQSYAQPSAALNHTQIEVAGDRYQLVLAATDPGVPNWVDTSGRSEGLLSIRYLVDRADTEVPTMRVVPLAEL